MVYFDNAFRLSFFHHTCWNVLLDRNVDTSTGICSIYLMFLIFQLIFFLPSTLLSEVRWQKWEKRLLASSCLSVCKSAFNNLIPTRRMFMKTDIWEFFEKYFEKNQASLKSDKNKWNFTWRTIYIFNNISLTFS
jgi:hypothetical protein